MALAAAIPKEVAEAMARLGVKALAPGGRAYRIAGKIIHLAAADGRKRALDTEAGVEVDPRTEKPLGGRAKEAAREAGGLDIGAVSRMIAAAAGEAVAPLAKRFEELEKALAGKADKK